MKYSTAMLKGFEKVGGRQCKGFLFEGDLRAPTHVCVNGAANLGRTGKPDNFDGWDYEVVAEKFRKQYGVAPVELNNGECGEEGLPWEHIYGMARAIGL